MGTWCGVPCFLALAFFAPEPYWTCMPPVIGSTASVFLPRYKGCSTLSDCSGFYYYGRSVFRFPGKFGMGSSRPLRRGREYRTICTTW